MFGAMLALCWLIFRSWASFFRSRTPLTRVLGVFVLTFDFFSVFWVAPGWMFGHPGTISRVRNHFFWCFVVRAGLQCEKSAHVHKPQFFLCFCIVFVTIFDMQQFLSDGGARRHRVLPFKLCSRKTSALGGNVYFCNFEVQLIFYSQNIVVPF